MRKEDVDKKIEKLDKLTKHYMGENESGGKVMVSYYITEFITTYFIPVAVTIYILAHIGYMVIFGYYLNRITIESLKRYNFAYSAVCIGILIFHLLRVCKIEKRYRNTADMISNDKVFNMCCNIMMELKSLRKSVIIGMLFLTLFSYLNEFSTYAV
jgi:hypothetical protein